MRLSHLATNVLWLAPLALQCAIAVAMYLRGLIRQYPCFFIYTVLLPCRDFVLLFLPYAKHSYSRVYWWGEAGAVLLSLGVILEIIWHFTQPYPFLRAVFRVVWIVAVLALIAAIAIWFWSNGPSGEDLVLEQIILLQRSARFLQVCVLIVAVALMSRLGLTWQRYSLGIAVGFGIYAALDLTLLELRGSLHDITDTTFVLLRSSAYNLAVIVWGLYFLRRPKVEVVDGLPLTDLANWNETLSQHVEKWYQS